MMKDEGKAKGQTVAVLPPSQDKRERMDKELQAASYARRIIEASLDPLVTIDADGKLRDVNKATELMTGVSRKRLIGTDFSKYFTEPDKAREGYKQAFSQGSVTDYPLVIRHTSGRTTDVLYNAAVYKDETGKVQGVFAAARDITGLKRAAAEASAKQTEVIQRQAQEILEISTPVMQVWEGVLVAPLIGTLDSQRTQQFMERLLQRIVATNSPMALVDVTGVPTIDTQTAQHLIDTISAVRLLGAQVILTGIRPAIAQTLVHLGVDLSGITTRSSLSGGLLVAMDSLGLQVTASQSTNGKEM
jgi:PAS domain S-box-containing protein